MIRTTPLRSESLRLERPRVRLAEAGRPLVGGVPEGPPDHRTVPGRLPGPRGDPLALQAAADLADRAASLPDPFEDLPDDSGLLRHDLVARLAVSVTLADVTIPIRGAAEHVDRAAAGGVLLAPAAAFQDLGPLVLGDHALDLDQQVLRGVMAEWVAQEDDLDPATGELFEDQNLICIFA